MKVHLDVSIFTADASVGHANADIELLVMPRAGELISLVTPKSAPFLKRIDGWVHMLEVERVIHNQEPAVVCLNCRDIEASSLEVAREIITFLERGCDFFFVPHLAGWG